MNMSDVSKLGVNSLGICVTGILIPFEFVTYIPLERMSLHHYFEKYREYTHNNNTCYEAEIVFSIGVNVPSIGDINVCHVLSAIVYNNSYQNISIEEHFCQQNKKELLMADTFIKSLNKHYAEYLFNKRG